MSYSTHSGEDRPRTPSGEKATEQCPICGIWNSPGAMDTAQRMVDEVAEEATKGLTADHIQMTNLGVR